MNRMSFAALFVFQQWMIVNTTESTRFAHNTSLNLAVAWARNAFRSSPAGALGVFLSC